MTISMFEKKLMMERISFIRKNFDYVKLKTNLIMTMIKDYGILSAMQLFQKKPTRENSQLKDSLLVTFNGQSRNF